MQYTHLHQIAAASDHVTEILLQSMANLATAILPARQIAAEQYNAMGHAAALCHHAAAPKTRANLAIHAAGQYNVMALAVPFVAGAQSQ